MRWKARTIDTNFDWELWYAWKPVTVWIGKEYITVWREYVERKPNFGKGDYDYRLPEKPVEEV